MRNLAAMARRTGARRSFFERQNPRFRPIFSPIPRGAFFLINAPLPMR